MRLATGSGGTQTLIASASSPFVNPPAERPSVFFSQPREQPHVRQFVHVQPGPQKALLSSLQQQQQRRRQKQQQQQQQQQPSYSPNQPPQSERQFTYPVVDPFRTNSGAPPSAPRRNLTYSEATLIPSTSAPSNPQLPTQQAPGSTSQPTGGTGNRRPRPSTDSPTDSDRVSPETGSSTRPGETGKPARKFPKY